MFHGNRRRNEDHQFTGYAPVKFDVGDSRTVVRADVRTHPSGRWVAAAAAENVVDAQAVGPAADLGMLGVAEPEPGR